MSRRPPSDNFTRFTSTSPHAAAKPPSSSFSYQPPTSQSTPRTQPTSAFNAAGTGPNGETPREKVARLRAAQRAAKASNNLSFVDRIIDRGRVWADISHRIVTYGLIFSTGIAACISVYGLSSLITHNRRQKRAWIEREMQRLQDAQTAFLAGTASPEQLHLLEQERAGEQMARGRDEEKKRKKEAGLWGRLKQTVGMDSGDMGRERSFGRGAAAAGAGQGDDGGERRLLEEARVDPSEAASSLVGGGSVMQAVRESRREGEKEVVARTGIVGGPLDVLADNVAGVVTPKSDKSWMSWSKGAGKS